MWYFWSVLNSQLLAPLFLLAVTGFMWTLVTVVRDRVRQAARLELLAGGFAAWMVITFVTPHHDIRYGLPLIGYLAVIGTGWIAHMPRSPRIAAIAVLIVGVLANTLGITFGVGHETTVALAKPLPNTEQVPDRIIIFATNGFLASAPQRDGDVPGLLDTLHREGVHTVAWGAEQSQLPDFSSAGLIPLAEIAELTPVPTRSLEYSRSASVATLIHEPVTSHTPAACDRLSDGTGVWIVRYEAAAGKLALYCPMRRPQFYDIGAVH
jgi:hypothetical protein